jgi:hypothetical protein
MSTPDRGEDHIARRRRLAIVGREQREIQNVDEDGVRIVYRGAGPADGPALLLLNGVPIDSHMLRDRSPWLGTVCMGARACRARLPKQAPQFDIILTHKLQVKDSRQDGGRLHP